MRHLLLLPCLAALTGCATSTTFVHSDAALGRVVVYRNGIAYFERTAHIDGDSLRLAVPADKVDDFLKSLTVVDARTGDPAPIAYPTTVPSSESGLIDMKISLTGPTSHDLRLSYVTEAPSWKPSYRMVLGKNNKVSVQAWAIVDNTSGEDWQNVQLGVGSSSALSFRFDLRSVRTVQRETLRSDDLFAQAPPMGGASYAQQQPGYPGGQPPAPPQKRVVADFSDEVLIANAHKEAKEKDKKAQVQVQSRSFGAGAAAPAKPADVGSAGGGKLGLRSRVLPNQDVAAGHHGVSTPPEQPPANQIEVMARTIQASKGRFVVEGYADQRDGDKNAASLERANRAREQLIRNGVDPSRVVAVGNGQQSGRAGGVVIAEALPDQKPVGDKSKISVGEPQVAGSDPIGTSHFESKSRMSVPRGTSAMVSILSTDTEGEVVYLYDAESARGNTTFPFRAVRIKNPTDSVLESGPVTVFGDGKFIGEGMSEPIPARSMAFVPFALDRQIMVERKEAGVDHIARIITVQRGVFSTEVQHTKRSTLTINNRLGDPATVWVRHTVAEGYKLTKGPEQRERLGTAYLFKVEVGPNAKSELVIEEATPLFRSTDIRSSEGMEMVTAYLSSAAVEGPIKAAVGELLKLHKEMANTEQQIGTMRDQMGEYRARMDELHAQIVTLKAVKTAGPLMQSLEKKLSEVSDKLSKSTIDLVGLQEKLMVARIKFQDGVADLSLEKKAEAPKG
jgi:hypothetical protein